MAFKKTFNVWNGVTKGAYVLVMDVIDNARSLLGSTRVLLLRSILNINVKPSHDLHVSGYYLCTTPHSIVAVHLPIRVRNTIETLFSIQRLQTLILTEIQ